MSNVRPSEDIILDACCLINLVVKSCMRDILVALPANFVVSKYVYEREALYTLADPTTGEREKIDLNPLISDGLLRIVDLMTEAETATFVDLTTKIEDGEANTCALALHRGYVIATDERKVLNLIRNSMPSVQTRATTEIIKMWADVTRVSNQRLRDVLMNVRSCARFAPNPQDPLHHWWHTVVGKP